MKTSQLLIQTRLDPLLHARAVDAAKIRRMTMARYIREALLRVDRDARDQAQAERFAEVIAALTQAIEELRQDKGSFEVRKDAARQMRRKNGARS